MYKYLVLFSSLFVWLLTGVNAEPVRSVLIEDFESGLAGWQEKEFLNQTQYTIVENSSGGKVLQAVSQGSASGLIKEFPYNTREYPVLTWRWKVSHTLKAGDAMTKEGDDYAARVYVIFPHWIKPLSRTINYIWANRLEVGKAVPNTYLSRAMMVAIESGDEHAGRWATVTRNVFEDYRSLFGEDPPQAGAIAIMTDTDNTGEEAQAWYDDIRIWSADPVK